MFKKTYPLRVPAAVALVAFALATTTSGCSRDTRTVTVAAPPAANPSLVLTSPAPGTSVVNGSPIAIEWTSADLQPGERITISYSSDGGATFTTIVSNTDDDGQFTWTPPAGSGSAVIRLESETGSASVVLGGAVSLAKVWFVDAGASGTRDGTSWATAFDRIQVAVDAASNGEQVWVKQGTYTAFSSGDPAVVEIRQRRLSLYGGFDGTETALSQRAVASGGSTIDGADARRGVIVEYSDDCRIDGFTITRGRATVTGGAGLYALEATNLTLEGCVLEGNVSTADASGAGALVEASSGVTITDCRFQDNICHTQKGGGLRVRGPASGSATLQVEGSQFLDNAAADGGGLALELATLDATLEDCVIRGNSATAGTGGGLHHLQALTTIGSCAFVSNRALYSKGGGVYFEGGTLDLSDSELRSNNGTTAGGLYATGGRVTVADCDVTGNLATTDGGGVAAHLVTLTVRDSTFGYNRAYRDGAGLWAFENTPTITATNTAFTSNEASRDGGAFSNVRSDVDLVDCTLSSNVANRGGAVFAQGTVDVTDSVLDGNSAQTGGGLWVGGAFSALVTGGTLANNQATYGGAGASEAATLELSNVVVDQNSTTGEGGALFTDGGTLSASDSTFSNNSADGDGGALSSWRGPIVLTDCTLNDNQSGRDGGAIAGREGPGTTITNCALSGNQSTRDGGAVFNVAQTATLTDSVLANNTAGRSGGGLEQIDAPSTITGGTLDSNTATWRGGGIHALGCAIAPGQMNVTMSGLTIKGNTATSTGTLLFGGGGVFLDEYAVGTLDKSDVVSNSSTVGDGGGVLNMGGTLDLINCVVANNSADDTGGGVYTAAWGKTTVRFSTVAGNSATQGAGVALMTAGTLALVPRTELDSTIVYTNSPDEVGSFDTEYPVDVSYSDIRTVGTLSFAGVNNSVDGDPLFVNGGSLDFNLSVGSAATDAGDPTSPPATDHDGTARGTPPNIGAFE